MFFEQNFSSAISREHMRPNIKQRKLIYALSPSLVLNRGKPNDCIWQQIYCCCSKPNSPNMTDVARLLRSFERSNSQRQGSEMVGGGCVCMCVCVCGAWVCGMGWKDRDCPLLKLRRQRSKWTFQTVTLEWVTGERGFLPPSPRNNGCCQTT